MQFRLDKNRWLGLIGGVALLAYVGWMGGPYLRSVILRDAAVTSWINPTTSPIAGYVEPHLLYAGDRVGTDGVIAVIADPLADRTALARAEADLDRAQERRQASEQLVAVRESTVEARLALAKDYAEAFKHDLDLRITAVTASLSLTKQRLGLERLQAARLAQLAASGHGSLAAADAETQLVVELEKTMATLQSDFDRSTYRRSTAEEGTFLLDDGTDAAIGARSLEEARLALNQAKLDLALAQVDVELAGKILDAARSDYEKARSASVAAPPGALVWSQIIAPGSAVQPGSPVASWIDCGVLMVDAPISDVELSLLPKGARADVVFEGETKVRRGTVILTRGAAATVGRADLAAIAKGREAGVGQALIKLDASPEDIAACPIGQAAYVDFPDIGLIDVLRARLRL
jgi:multidrug resistance efflux pump